MKNSFALLHIIVTKQRIIHAEKRAYNPHIFILHEHYTPKTIKKQAVLAIFTIFVNYADFYVNIIM